MRPLCPLARSFIGKQLVYLDLIELTFGIPVEAADPDITDTLTSQDASLHSLMCQERLDDRPGQLSRNPRSYPTLTRRMLLTGHQVRV